MIFTVFIGLGTNLGNREFNLKTAKNLLSESIGEVISASKIIETPAWGIENQPDFLNQVLEIKTSLFPFELLEKVLGIEEKMGRIRKIKWGERNIDIDILFIENLVLHSESLTVPHPFLHLRKFVLEPLTEISPNFQHPILKKKTYELLHSLQHST
jgi:2-amino-4-hydroxy-6-hydroxymethyldihydropteridine diphosphokinase